MNGFRDTFEAQAMGWLKKAWGQFAALIILAAVWGSSFILMKKGLRSFSADQVAQTRLTVAFIALLPFAILRLREKFPRQPKRILGLIVVGLCGNLIPAFLFAHAQTRIPSGLAGMLNSLVPLFTLIIGVIVFRLEFTRRQMIGVLVGFVGAFVLVVSSSQLGFQTPLIYPLMVVGATLCYATSVNTIKAILPDMNAVDITAFSFLFVGPAAVLVFLDHNILEKTRQMSQLMNLGYVVLLGLVGTAGALLLFNSLIKHTSAIFASSVTYLIPIFAILWGAIDGEEFKIQQLLAMGVILAGIYLTNRKAAK